MFIESVRARATCNTIISSHPISSHRPCIPPWSFLVSFSLFLLAFCLFALSIYSYISLSLSLFVLDSTFITFSTFPRRPLFAFSHHLIPHLRDVHSILSHLLEVTQDLPSSYFPWATDSFIHFYLGKRGDRFSPISVTHLIFI